WRLTQEHRVATEWIAQNAVTFGLCLRLAYEDWHVETAESCEKKRPMAPLRDNGADFFKKKYGTDAIAIEALKTAERQTLLHAPLREAQEKARPGSVAKMLQKHPDLQGAF